MSSLNSVEKRRTFLERNIEGKGPCNLLFCDATPDISHIEHNLILLRYEGNKKDD